MPSLGLGLSLENAGVVPNPIIPASLTANALALYTTRPQGLSDYAVNMTNAVTNGDFAVDTNSDGLADNWSKSGTSVCTFVVGEQTFTPTQQYAGVRQILTYLPGDTLIICGWVKTTDNTARLQISDIDGSPSGNQVHSGSGNYEFLVGRLTTIAGMSGLHALIYTSKASGWTSIAVKNIMVVNLSTPFGLSNEPTATEFADMLTYKGKTFWNGTEPVVINPNDKYYWPDRSGNNRHLHLVNLPYDATGGLQAGPPANYLFDGVNDYAVYNSATDIVAANGAVSAFVVFQAKDTVAASHRILQVSDGTASISGAISISTSGISFVATDSTSGTSDAFVSNAFAPNKWYSAVAIYDPATKKAGLSLNGGTIVWSATALTNGIRKITKVTLAANFLGSAFNNDRFSELPLLNKVTTQADCKALHNNIASRYGLTKV